MKSARSVVAVAVAGITVVGSSGCSGSGAGQPTSNDYDNVAQSTAALLIQASGGGEVGSMYDSASLAVGVTPAGVTANGVASFGDAHAGLDYSLTISCVDAAGVALSACGANTNDARASVTWNGNLTLPPDFAASVSRQGTWTLSGVQSGTATFEGSGTFDLSAQFTSIFHGAKASVDVSYGANYHAVTYSMAAHHPTGGSIDYAIAASSAASGARGDSGGSFTMGAHVVFNPDGSATMTLDGTYEYVVLASGIVIKL